MPVYITGSWKDKDKATNKLVRVDYSNLPEIEPMIEGDHRYSQDYLIKNILAYILVEIPQLGINGVADYYQYPKQYWRGQGAEITNSSEFLEHVEAFRKTLDWLDILEKQETINEACSGEYLTNKALSTTGVTSIGIMIAAIFSKGFLCKVDDTTKSTSERPLKIGKVTFNVSNRSMNKLELLAKLDNIDLKVQKNKTLKKLLRTLSNASINNSIC